MAQATRRWRLITLIPTAGVLKTIPPPQLPRYDPSTPEPNPRIQQGVASYDPQLAGYAHPLARRTSIWYCRWVEDEP